MAKTPSLKASSLVVPTNRRWPAAWSSLDK
jgi:hypothetical protein